MKEFQSAFHTERALAHAWRLHQVTWYWRQTCELPLAHARWTIYGRIAIEGQYTSTSRRDHSVKVDLTDLLASANGSDIMFTTNSLVALMLLRVSLCLPSPSFNGLLVEKWTISCVKDPVRMLTGLDSYRFMLTIGGLKPIGAK